jgi:hypothetical protein
VQIVLEPLAEALHQTIQFLLAGMGQRRMANVMGEGQGFYQRLVEAQH